jgi:hypothetical protein
VTFLFRFEDAISRPGVRFSAGNPQRYLQNPLLHSVSEFDSLDFEAIYHDGALGADRQEYVKDCRQAEVLVPDGLPLNEALAAIIFRTKWDLETFRALCAEARVACPYRLGIEQVQLSAYMRWGMYINDMTFDGRALTLQFHRPARNLPADNMYKLGIRQSTGAHCMAFSDRVEIPSWRLTVAGFRSDDRAVWNIDLEDTLAFYGPIPVERSETFQ